jgi:non-specific serine/threonine protein kinase
MQRLADRSQPGVPASTLTPVQRQILGMLADGLSNQAIANRLGVARATVSQHTATILWRLGLTSRTEIALWAVKQAPEPRDR